MKRIIGFNAPELPNTKEIEASKPHNLNSPDNTNQQDSISPTIKGFGGEYNDEDFEKARSRRILKMEYERDNALDQAIAEFENKLEIIAEVDPRAFGLFKIITTQQKSPEMALGFSKKILKKLSSDARIKPISIEAARDFAKALENYITGHNTEKHIGFNTN